MESQITTSDFRFERKFFITDFTIHNVVSAVEFHSAIFQKIYHKRYINNIYFDTDNLECYHDNIDGKSNRLKVRVRWYGNLLGWIENPVLEIKIKKGLVGNKISVPLKSFQFDTISDIAKLQESISKLSLQLPIDFGFFKPTLINRYLRTYYQTFDKKIRITLDEEQYFYEALNFNTSFFDTYKDQESVILEMKYAKENDIQARKIIADFPFRLTRSSKYVRGIELIGG